MNGAFALGHMPGTRADGDRARTAAIVDPTTRGSLQGPAGLSLDSSARRAFAAGRELAITTQLFDLLAFFLDHRGAAVSFEELAAEVWAYPYGAGDHHFVHTAVYRLRRILHAAGIDGLIEGVRGFGYRISAAPEPTATPAKAIRTAGRAIAVFDPFDPNLRFTMANEAALELTGYELEVLMDLPGAARRLWTPDERAIIDRVVRDALASGTATTSGRQLLRANGETVAVDVFLSRLDVANGSPLCVAEARKSDR